MEASPWDPEDVEVRLDADGRLSNSSGDADASGLDLRALYKGMVRVRHLDIALNSGSYGIPMRASSAGEEAVVTACATLAADDEWIYPGARDTGVALLRGADLDLLVQQMRGRSYTGIPGAVAATARSVGHAPETLGAHLAFAAGQAHAASLADGPRPATIALFGEGLATVGFYRETLSLAVACDLPLVLVCKSQLWPEGAPAEAGVFGESVSERARAVGLWSRRVDGADIVGVHEAVAHALDRARRGHGPGLVEAVVTQLQHRRAPAHRDPIERLRKHLDGAGVWNATFQDVIEAEIRGQLAKALERATTSDQNQDQNQSQEAQP